MSLSGPLQIGYEDKRQQFIGAECGHFEFNFKKYKI